MTFATYDNFALLADAFRHGRLWIDWPGGYIEAVAYNGHRYVIEGPFPAILTLPFVFFVGPTPLAQSLACWLTGIVGAIGAWNLCRDWRLWLFMLFGTDFVWASWVGWLWMFSGAAAFTLTTWAIVELRGQRRGWVLGLLGVCAAETRFTLLPALLLYGWYTKDRRIFCAILLGASVIWVAYNEGRWGTVMDLGFPLWCASDYVCSGGLFSLAYVKEELYSFLINPTFTIYGTALTLTSPALIVAAWAPLTRESRLITLTTMAVALPSLCYYTNGVEQVGMRHALDFEPFIIALMATARLGWLFNLMTAWSLGIGVFNLWNWPRII